MKKAKSIRVICVTPQQEKTVHVHVSCVKEADADPALARAAADFAARRDGIRAEIARGGRRTSGRIL